MIKESYSFKRKLTVYFGVLSIISVTLPILFLASLIDTKDLYFCYVFIFLSAYSIGYKSLKQINISPDQIEIINIFSKKIIKVNDIAKISEGYFFRNMGIAGKSIIIELKEGTRYTVYSKYLDEKSKQLLLAI